MTFAGDFDELWRTLAERYCFFGEKRTDWNRVRSLYRPLAVAADSNAAFSDVLRRVLAELYDTHTQLTEGAPGTPRLPPFDLLVERSGSVATIAAMLEGSAAADAGLKIGDRISAVSGQPVQAVARDLAPKCLSRPDPAADAYALNVAVSGRRGQVRNLTVQSDRGSPRRVVLPLKKWPEVPDLESRRLTGGIGYIAIRSFVQEASIEAFDKALAEFRDAPGLIIDVRENGGGDTAVARPIMGRFITERKPYALMRRRQGLGLSAPWTEYVDPRGPFTFTAPVVVLTNRWSGSMAEGFPMGMRGLGRAKIVGAPMMGLGAAVFSIKLDRTGVQAQYSAEPVYDIHDQPRWRLRPDVVVKDGDDVLATGIAELSTRPFR